MANQVNTNPMVVDSTGLLFTGQGRVKAVLFVNDGADGDLSLEITDAVAGSSTKLVAKLELTAEQKTKVFTPPDGVNFTQGLWCETIDGGKALVYV